MSQSVEGYVPVPTLTGTGTNVRNLQFQIAQPLAGQPQGQINPVYVQAAVLVDADTGLPISSMTKAQADTVIGLLQDIRDKLTEIYEK